MQTIRQKVDRLLMLWEKLDILAGEDEMAGKYETRINDFINGGIIITPPHFIGGNTRLRDNMPVVVHFNRNDAAYKFHSRIRTRHLRGVRQMILTPPRRIQRVQRRMFVRIETGSVAEYARIPRRAEAEDREGKFDWIRTTCVNISGGGALIEIEEEFKTQDCLLLKLQFLKKYNLPATVAAVTRRSTSIGKKRHIGVEYILAERLRHYFTRDLITQFPPSVSQFDRARREMLVAGIFSEQVEMRKKGLL